jgi:hypothetical protein
MPHAWLSFHKKCIAVKYSGPFGIVDAAASKRQTQLPSIISETRNLPLALNLNSHAPRSPRAILAGYCVVARTLDKCRAVINGSEGEYHYDCPLDRMFFDFTGIDSGEFKAFVAESKTDDEVAEFIREKAIKRDRIEVIKWNHDLLYKRIPDMPDELQEFLWGYIQEFCKGKPVYHWFDVYDIEEGRI